MPTNGNSATPGKYPGNPPPNQNPVVGSGTVQEKRNVAEVTQILSSAIRNFRQFPITIVEGVKFNQYELLETTHAYLNSQFQSGSEDENGDERYFHNIITPRNAHATKNIDLDTKDLLITAENSEGWWFSFLLKNALQDWMQRSGFASLLNEIATDLPNFGKVIIKKCGEGSDMNLKTVDLRSVVFNPSAKSIEDSGLFFERSVMEPHQMMAKTRAPKKGEDTDEKKESDYDGGYWDRAAVVEAIRASSTKRDNFISKSGAPTSSSSEYSLTDTMAVCDVWEVYGWLPEASIDALQAQNASQALLDSSSNADVDYIYVKLVLANLESGTPYVLYIDRDIEPKEDFCYKEINFFRRVPGRCMPQSNSEVLITLQVRMNELVSRFFKAIRMGSLHLFQTRQGIAYKNLMQDAQDGDILVTKYPIDPVATEIRAFQQYQAEVQNIENQADRLCNTTDIVTGDNLPTNTPFRSASQMSLNANKIFDQVREDVGIVLTDIFNDWILPELMDELSLGKVMEVTGSLDELKMFDEGYRKFIMAQSVKDYVIKNNKLPSEEELSVLENALAADQKNRSRKVSVPDKFFTMDTIKSLRIRFDMTDERKNFTAQRDSMTTLLQTIASNPMIMQDETTRTLIGYIMESAGISPMMLPAFASKPTPKQLPAGAASPASQGGAGDQTTQQATADVAAAQAA